MASRKQRPSLDLIQTVTGSTFDSLVLENSGAAVVEFMSYGCAYCREIEPIVQQVAQNIESRVMIFRVNVSADPDISETYAVEATPTFVMFLNGTEVARVVGPTPIFKDLMSALTEPFGPGLIKAFDA